MKKLLTIFTTFGILTSTGLSIISCGKTKEQKTIDNAIEQLKDQKFLIITDDKTTLAVEKAIINHNGFKTLFKDLEVEIKSWQFKKDNYDIDNQFQDNCEYDVILNIKKNNEDKSEVKTGSVNFKIKLNIKNHLQQAISKLEKIKDIQLDVEMSKNNENIETTTIEEVINTFEQIEDYQAVFSNNNISKEKIKLYKKNHLDKEVEITSNNDLIDQANIIIKTKLTDGDITKTLTFNVKLSKIVRQIDLNLVTLDLQQYFIKNCLLVNSTSTYFNLDLNINSLKYCNNKPFTDCQIKYYDQEIEGTEITNDYQTTGKIWVEIIANANNLHWKGQTNRIAVTLEKTNLNKIKTLTDKASTSLKFVFDQTKTYAMIDEQIINASEFKNKPLNPGYQIKYYTKKLFSYKEINQDTEQQPGTIYAEIIASNDDPNWFGQTAKIAVESLKLNLNTIQSLTSDNNCDLNPTIDLTKKYCDLNEQISNAKEFSAYALNKNHYQIKYYDQEIEGTEITNNVQTAGKVWVEIIANANNSIWEGQTKRIAINISKLNLNDIHNLTYNDFDSNFKVNSTKKYCDLNEQIIDANEFENQAITDHYQIKYYDQEIEGTEITNNVQTAGKVWVEIIANANNSIWEGQTNRIGLKLVKANLNKQTLTSDSIDDLEIEFDHLKTYENINEQIINASEFKNKPLNPGYQIKYYTKKLFSYKEINQDTKPQPGTIYVEIIASNDDSNWSGQTDKIAIKISFKIE